jgi:hypothetical protein
LFADRPARTVDADLWEAHHAELDVRVVYNPGIVVAVDHRAPAHVEVRALRMNRRPLDDIDLMLTRIRLRALGVATADLVAVELLDADVRTFEIDLALDAARDEEWLTEAAAQVAARATSARERPGKDCRDCAFVIRCNTMRGATPDFRPAAARVT